MEDSGSRSSEKRKNSRVHVHQQQQQEQQLQQQEQRKGRRVSLSDSLTLQSIRTYFDQPLKAAAEHLGVSVNCLKRACRRLGISRWPYKELRGVRSALAGVPSLIQTASPEQRAQLEGIIASLRAEEEELLTVGSKNRSMLEETWESEGSSADAKHDGTRTGSSKRARRSPQHDNITITDTADDADDHDHDHDHNHHTRQPASPQSSIESNTSPQQRVGHPFHVPTDRSRLGRDTAQAPRPWLINQLRSVSAPLGLPPPPAAAAAAAGTSFPYATIHHVPAHPSTGLAPKLVDVELLRRLTSLEQTVAQLASRQTQLETYLFSTYRAF